MYKNKDSPNETTYLLVRVASSIPPLAQVCNLCVVLKANDIFCSNEQHTNYKSARAGKNAWANCLLTPYTQQSSDLFVI